MKRYALFGGSFYYPVGGWSDLIGTFDTVKEAQEEAYKRNPDWYQIIDLQTGEDAE